MSGDTEKRTINKSYLALAVIILCQILFVSYYMVFEKENYHSDEPWSYGLSNSFYQPFLFGDTHDGYCSISIREWLSGEDLHNYLTVQKAVA